MPEGGNENFSPKKIMSEGETIMSEGKKRWNFVKLMKEVALTHVTQNWKNYLHCVHTDILKGLTIFGDNTNSTKVPKNTRQVGTRVSSF